MNGKLYRYNIDFAKKYGERESLIITYFQHWNKKNRKTKGHQFHNRSWTYITKAKLLEIYPHLTIKKIRNAIDSLVKQKILLVSKFNTKKTDHTNWYAFKNEPLFLDGVNTMNNDNLTYSDKPRRANRLAPEGQSYTKTIIKNTIIKNIPKKEYNPAQKGGIVPLLENESPYIKTIPMPIFEILHAMKKEWGFTTKLPEPNKPITKTLQEVIKYITWIKSGMFNREIKLDPKWVEDYINVYPRIQGYGTWEEVKIIIIASLSAYKKDMQRFGKQDKPLEKLEAFFQSGLFSGGSPKSMFLKYFPGNCEPKTQTEQTTEWQKKNLTEEVVDSVQEFLDNRPEEFSENFELQFWSSINNLQAWYKKNDKRLDIYNKAWSGNNWNYHCSSFPIFINRALDYLTTWKRLPNRPLVPDSGDTIWIKFTEWLMDNWSIDIDIDPDKEKEAENEIEDRKRQARNKELSNIAYEIQQQCEEAGLPRPPFTEAFVLAEKRLNDKKSIINKNLEEV